MKFSITSRQPKELLNKADEIVVAYKDIKQILDLGHDYDKPIILDIPNQEYSNVNWPEITNYNILAKNNLVLKLHTFDGIAKCKENNLKFYIDYPLSSFEEIEQAITLGFSYLRVNDTLFFNMDLLDTYNIPIRFNPLGSGNHYLKGEFEISAWVRPEDIDLYKNGVMELNNLSVEKEAAIYEVYAEKKEWPFQLNLLIPEIKSDLLNSLVAPDFGERRYSCGKRCKVPNKSCHYCDLTLNLANMQNKIKQYKDLIDKK